MWRHLFVWRNPGKDDDRRRETERNAKALAGFPFERLEIHGSKALALWTEIKASGRGSPVVLGVDGDIGMIMDIWSCETEDGPVGTERTASEILEKAASLRHPRDLFAREKEDDADALALLEADPKPESGRWLLWTLEFLGLPKPSGLGLSVAHDVLSNRPLPKVHVAIIPTADWTEIPAYLCWGDWNANPPPEYHVAALRSWRDRYGAELIGLSHDVMDLRVARRPATREEALDLAREQYSYCDDIVDQGRGSLSRHARNLMAADWWTFWWD